MRAGSRGGEADAPLGTKVRARAGRCTPPPGMMGTHSRGCGTFSSSIWASETETGSDSGPVHASMGSWDDGAAAVLARSSLSLCAEDDDDDDVGASFCHFSRARRRFGVCGPRADSGEKPSKASHAAAKWGNFFSFAARDTEMGSLRLKISEGPRTVPSIPFARGGVIGRGDHRYR